MFIYTKQTEQQYYLIDQVDWFAVYQPNSDVKVIEFGNLEFGNQNQNQSHGLQWQIFVFMKSLKSYVQKQTILSTRSKAYTACMYKDDLAHSLANSIIRVSNLQFYITLFWGIEIKHKLI